MPSSTQSESDGPDLKQNDSGVTPHRPAPPEDSDGVSGKLGDIPDVLNQLREHWKELQQEVADFISLQIAGVRLQTWTIFLNWAFACSLAVAGLAIVVVAVVLLLQGLTGGLAILLNGRMWASQMIVGGAALTLSVLTIRVATNRLTELHRRQILEKHEHRHHE